MTELSDKNFDRAILLYEAVEAERNRLLKAMETAKQLIGAVNDSAPASVKESNINMAWHVLDDNLRVSIPSRDRKGEA